MKSLAMIFFLSTFYHSPGMANGGAGSTDMRRGTAAIDEKYTDELNTKDSAIQRTKKTRQEMIANPRNPAFSESFGQIHSHEDDQEKQEESFKFDPYWDNSEKANGKIDNRDPRD